MADNLDFLDQVEQPATVEAAESTETQETGAEETQVAAETTAEESVKTGPTDAEKALQAELGRMREKNRRLEAEATAEKQRQSADEEDPYKAEIKAEIMREQEWREVQLKRNITEAIARDKYPDFQEKLDAFIAMADEDPLLVAKMDAQANPAEFVYKTATAQQKMKEMGDPLAYEAKLEEKIRAKIAAEQEAEKKKRTDLPGSLATAPAASTATTAAWAGPTSLDDLLK